MEDNQKVSIEQLQVQIDALKDKISQLENSRKDQLSIAVVSGDLDKVLAAMVNINCRCCHGHSGEAVFLWSLSALRDPNKSPKGKDIISKMFGCMLLRGTKKLKLSNMNMAGIAKNDFVSYENKTSCRSKPC